MPERALLSPDRLSIPEMLLQIKHFNKDKDGVLRLPVVLNSSRIERRKLNKVSNSEKLFTSKRYSADKKIFWLGST